MLYYLISVIIIYKKGGEKMTPEQKINLVTALINLASAILMLYKANK